MSAYGDTLRASLAAIEYRENARWDGEQFVPWEQAMTETKRGSTGRESVSVAAGAAPLTDAACPGCPGLNTPGCERPMCLWQIQHAEREHEGIPMEALEKHPDAIRVEGRTVVLFCKDRAAAAKLCAALSSSTGDERREAIEACAKIAKDKELFWFGERDKWDAIGMVHHSGAASVRASEAANIEGAIRSLLHADGGKP